MYDLRATHQHSDLQDFPRSRIRDSRLSKGPYFATHHVRINNLEPGERSAGKRQIFTGDQFGSLRGYDNTASNATIIHPSVYFMLDTYATLGVRQSLEHLHDHLQSFRQRAELTPLFDGKESNLDSWVREAGMSAAGSCRTFVCGNTGVGKSTLINRVFGIPITSTSNVHRGVHDINNAFESDQHPGVILHDSEGFQSGSLTEVAAFKEFLRRLCIETDDSRPVHTALANILREVWQNAPSLPVIVVGTKTDKYLHFLPPSQQGLDALPQAEAKFRNAFKPDAETSTFWSELNVQFSFVSHDMTGIKSLIRLTMESLDSEATEAMCAAQIRDIDAKIDLAVEKTLSLLRSTMFTASLGLGSGFTSLVATPTISRVLCDRIAHEGFGIPKARIDSISSILDKVVWANMSSFMAQRVGQAGLWSGALLLTILTFGMTAPVVAGAAVIEAPSAARMMIKCACDMILILDQAFRDGDKYLTASKIGIVPSLYMRSTIPYGLNAGQNRRKCVHRAINHEFPLLAGQSWLTHKEINLTNYRITLRGILESYRFRAEPTFLKTLEHGEQVIAELEGGVESTPELEANATQISEDGGDIRHFRAIAELP